MKSHIFRALLLVLIIVVCSLATKIDMCASKTYVFNESDMRRDYIQRDNVCDVIYNVMFADSN